MAKKKDNVYPWIILVLGVLWFLGSVWPAFGKATMSVPWFPLIVIFAALGWLAHNK